MNDNVVVVFDDMSISEQIEFLADKYRQDRSAGGMERIGQKYGMSSRNAARYVRCDRLIHEFKFMLDTGLLTVAAGVDLSFLSGEEQRVVLDVMECTGVRVDRAMANKLKSRAGSITREGVQAIFKVDRPAVISKMPVNVVLPARVYKVYFGDVAVKDVQEMVEEALELYFDGKGV